MIVGLDMGGTHIDAVIIKDGKIINNIKRAYDSNNLFQDLWGSLQSLLNDYDKSQIKRINLSTTISTNAIVEDKTSSVGMIIQSGPGLSNDFLACGDENVFVSGSIDHRGNVVQELDISELKKAVILFKDKNINNCAIVTKFSTRNPKHEIEIKKFIEDDFSFITMGHSLSGKLNFPRRVFTAYLNAAVYDSFKNFAINIKKSLEKEGISAPVFILKADGGTINLSTTENIPVETILSGPAASFMGMNAFFSTDEDAILLDIGGTTTDIFFLADGIPLFESQGIQINHYKTLVRSIFSVSMGLGGDSSIRIKDGQLKIGPKREGPPYAFGGPMPTPTDAMITLGLIHVEDEEIFKKAKKSIESLTNGLNQSVEDMAITILNTMAHMIKNRIDELLGEINSKPVYTVRELLYGKTITPKSIQIIGGPAKVLSKILEKRFNLPCYYPKNHHIANAIGAALAKPTTEINMLVDTSKRVLSVPELGLYERVDKNYTLDDAKKRALSLLEKEALNIGSDKDIVETEIVEESSFNMVRGFYTTGKNIRIKAQIKPGLSYKLKDGAIDVKS